MSDKPSKPTSLTALGYKIVTASGKDAKDNEFVFKVTGPAPVFYVKETKKGRLVAVKDKESAVESTIEGLYNFKVENGDLIGQRAPSVSTVKTQKVQKAHTTQKVDGKAEGAETTAA